MAMRPPLPPPPLSGGVPGVLQISRRGHEKREPAGVELPSAVILSSRRRVDSSRIEAARRARSTESGNGKHSFLR